MNIPHSAVLVVALAGAALAQNPLGTFTNTGVTFSGRGNATAPNNNPAYIFDRFDKETYAGFTTGAVPFTRQITGVNAVIQDQNLATQELFTLAVFQGDPQNPNFPDVQSVVVSGPFVLPLATGNGAFDASANFATPITVPSTEDVYVGLQFMTAWTLQGGVPVDGLSVHEIRNVAPAQPQAWQGWDLAGARLPTTVDRSYGGYYVPNPPSGPAYPVVTQYKIQPIVPISGGVATTLSNQANHAESTAAAAAGFTVQEPGAGTACMFSGLYPDAASPPRNSGRADDIGQLFFNPALSAGSPVFFLMDFGPFPSAEIPVASFVPGSTGVACLNFGSMVALGFGFLGTNGRAFRVSTFPAAARPLLSGIPWAQQAVALDTGSNTLHATACTIQRT